MASGNGPGPTTRHPTKLHSSAGGQLDAQEASLPKPASTECTPNERASTAPGRPTARVGTPSTPTPSPRPPFGRRPPGRPTPYSSRPYRSGYATSAYSSLALSLTPAGLIQPAINLGFNYGFRPTRATPTPHATCGPHASTSNSHRTQTQRRRSPSTRPQPLVIARVDSGKASTRSHSSTDE